MVTALCEICTLFGGSAYGRGFEFHSGRESICTFILCVMLSCCHGLTFHPRPSERIAQFKQAGRPNPLLLNKVLNLRQCIA
jgi:hypothetical protein